MSVSLASRALMRQNNRQFVLRRSPFRWASTTEKASETTLRAASTTKSTASNIQSKASEGLPKVTSSAGPAISGAASRVGNAVRSIGGPIGRLVQAVESTWPSIQYNSRVAFELSKIVFHGQRMAPPSISEFQSYLNKTYQFIRQSPSLLRHLDNPSTWEPVLSRLRNLNRASIGASLITWLVTGGVVVTELLGFFTVGTMIGRLKIVGYHGEPNHDNAHLH